MGLRALERRLVLLRAFLAVREEVDGYLDLAKRRRSLPNPAELSEAIRKRGLDPPGLLKGRNYLWECSKDGTDPDRDDLVCRILGIDRWLVNAIEDSTPPELRKAPQKAERSAILAQQKQLQRQLEREWDARVRSMLNKVRRARAEAEARRGAEKGDPSAMFAEYEQMCQDLDVVLRRMRGGGGGTK